MGIKIDNPIVAGIVIALFVSLAWLFTSRLFAILATIAGIGLFYKTMIKKEDARI